MLVRLTKADGDRIAVHADAIIAIEETQTFGVPDATPFTTLHLMGGREVVLGSNYQDTLDVFEALFNVLESEVDDVQEISKPDPQDN